MIYSTTTDLVGNTVIVKTDENGKVSYIPNDPNNSDYKIYLASIQQQEQANPKQEAKANKKKGV